jgi:hypothetical protein
MPVCAWDAGSEQASPVLRNREAASSNQCPPGLWLPGYSFLGYPILVELGRIKCLHQIPFWGLESGTFSVPCSVIVAMTPSSRIPCPHMPLPTWVWYTGMRACPSGPVKAPWPLQPGHLRRKRSSVPQSHQSLYAHPKQRGTSQWTPLWAT